MAKTRRPQLTNAARPATFEVEANNERGEMVPTSIAGEHPLTLYLDKRELVTLMTLGHAPGGAGDRLPAQPAPGRGHRGHRSRAGGLGNRVGCRDFERKVLKGIKEKIRKKTVTTGCGQGTVYGDLMEEIDRVKLREDVSLEDADLYALVDKVRKHETIYKQAGAVHGCALATLDGEILMFVEDVGRHNAVDAIAGFMWLEGIDGSDKVFYTTGRLTSEMVIKCAQMRIPFLVSRSGLTKMGHDIARQVGLTMIGRASGRHYLAFTGKHRLKRTAPQPTAIA